MNTRKTLRGEVRAVDDSGTVTVMAVAYSVPDDYGSVWMPGVFARSLAERQPTFAWAHNWSEPIGRGLSSEDTADGQMVTLRLDLDDAVPRALQAHAQMRSGTLDDVSVGFSNVTRRPPTDDEKEQYPGVTEIITDADLDEISVVLRGAVPGAKVLAVRAAGGQVDIDAAVEIARRKVAGDLSEAEADEALRLLSIDGAGDGEGEPAPPVVEDPDAAAGAAASVVAAEAAADEALATVADRSSARR